MKKITKALFPVAGMGTRMLPATKVIPKELLPLYSTPILDVLVSECVDAGIEEIILITSREKFLIESYFDSFPELERKLEKKGDLDRLARIQKFKKVKFSAIRQGEQNGDGHAILCAKHLLKDEPFLVVFGDELTLGTPNSIEQLIDAYEKQQNTIIGVRKVPKETISSYGVVKPDSDAKITKISAIQEKPAVEDAYSDMAVIGKYVCTPEIWDALKNCGTSEDGEVRLADGFIKMLGDTHISACTIDGLRFDTGNAKGYFFANLEMALRSGNISPEEVVGYVQNRVAQ